MPHLESVLDEQLSLWFARPISGVTSVSCLTGETSVPGIEPETCSHPSKSSDRKRPGKMTTVVWGKTPTANDRRNDDFFLGQ